MHPAALEYSARGWVAIPVNGKIPLIKGWQTLRTTYEGPEWAAPGVNVGIVTGAISGLVVLDVDVKSGGLTSLTALEFEHGYFRGPWVETGSGGRHLYFSHPGTKISNSAGKLGPGLDIRGDGGFVVAPPSRNEAGKPYAWRHTGDLPKMPAWLLEKLGISSQVPSGGPSRQKQTLRPSKQTSEWAALINDGVSSGSRNHTAASLTGYLLRHNLPEDVVGALISLWNENRLKPPLDEIELDSVLRSISIRDAKNGER
jgi:hypothetical protein